MGRKRLTERFPFLIPLRRWQRRLFFYWGMCLDKNRYSKEKAELFPYIQAESSMPLINEESGQDIQYQYNKVHNLRLAAATVDGVVIRPGETFSFWQLVRHAQEREKYKDGLVLINGRIMPSPGGGLCQLSDLLFWLFLHTPLTVVERHPHGVKAFPTPDVPAGTDATVSEGWKDLKVRNDTGQALQIQVCLDERKIYGRIRREEKPLFRYEIKEQNLRYYREKGEIWESVSLFRQKYSLITGDLVSQLHLYENRTVVTYPLPEEDLSPGEEKEQKTPAGELEGKG